MPQIEVCTENLDSNPQCPHGPMVLFSRSSPKGKCRFFACSACRDRKLCNFFAYQNDAKAVEKLKERLEKHGKIFNGNLDHKKLFLRFKKIKKLPQNQRIFCQTCCHFTTIVSAKKHENHRIIQNISNEQLKMPTINFLPPDSNAKFSAQFFFNARTISTLITILKELNYTKILSVCAPRIHQTIVNEHNLEISSLLMDLDERYHSFYSPAQFCRYNCFNHYFFGASISTFNDFLRPSDGATTNSLAVIIDPPFGGRLELLARTIQLIQTAYRNLNNQKDVGIFLVLPYFMETLVMRYFAGFTMLDYKVEYENQAAIFKGRKQGSPIRIFTNLEPRRVALPTTEGYKFCERCKKWTSAENRHCTKCKSCTSKNGTTYRHCEKCRRCVKPSRQHCDICRKCCQPNHQCGETSKMKSSKKRAINKKQKSSNSTKRRKVVESA